MRESDRREEEDRVRSIRQSSNLIGSTIAPFGTGPNARESILLRIKIDGLRLIGRGIGILVCVSKNEVSLDEGSQKGAPGKEGRAGVALIFRRASARKPIRRDKDKLFLLSAM